MSKKIHIMNIVLSLEPGGLENGVVNVVNNLDASRFKTTICCLQVKGDFANRIESKETEITEMNMRDGNDYGLILKLAKYIRDRKPDIVHTRNQKSYFHGFVSGRLAGVSKFVHSEHGRTFPGKKRKMMLQGLLSRHTDAVVSVSNKLKKDLEAHAYIPEGKIKVIYNGVDGSRFQLAGREVTRTELGYRDTDIVIGVVGRMEQVKNYKLLIDVLADIQDTRNIRLLAIGEGLEKIKLEKQVNDSGLGKIAVFPGYMENVERYYAAMDIFVLPSFSEGLSNTLLEAMISGVAAIGSKVGGNKEIIRDNDTGLLFTSNSKEELSNCIVRLLDEKERQRLSTNARHDISERFSIDRMVHEYEDLYMGVYQGSG